MRDIDTIVIHCSATPEGLDIGAAQIDQMHRARGFNGIGYHFVVRLDGRKEIGRQIEAVGAHVAGHNAHSIGICYVGGLDAARKPKDTRTRPQLDTLEGLVLTLLELFPGARVVGHRDLSPDRNHDGKITPDEWMKDCPCFDVATWHRSVLARAGKE